MSEIIYKLILKPEKKNSLRVGDWVKFLLCDVHRHCTWQINRIKRITPHGDGFLLGNGEYYEFQNLYPFDLYIVSIGEDVNYYDEFIDLIDLSYNIKHLNFNESKSTWAKIVAKKDEIGWVFDREEQKYYELNTKWLSYIIDTIDEIQIEVQQNEKNIVIPKMKDGKIVILL